MAEACKRCGRVPARGDVVGVARAGAGERARKAEIAQLQDACSKPTKHVAHRQLVRSSRGVCGPNAGGGGRQRTIARDEEVLGLDVTVDDIVGVAVVNRAQQLPQALFRLDWVHAVWIALQVLQNGALHILKDEVQLRLAAEDLDEVDNVVVLELLRPQNKKGARSARHRFFRGARQIFFLSCGAGIP